MPLARCRHKTKRDIDIDLYIEHTHPMEPDYGSALPIHGYEHERVLIYEALL